MGQRSTVPPRILGHLSNPTGSPTLGVTSQPLKSTSTLQHVPHSCVLYRGQTMKSQSHSAAQDQVLGQYKITTFWINATTS